MAGSASVVAAMMDLVIRSLDSVLNRGVFGGLKCSTDATDPQVSGRGRLLGSPCQRSFRPTTKVPPRSEGFCRMSEASVQQQDLPSNSESLPSNSEGGFRRAGKASDRH
jgi:hypothetical protein